METREVITGKGICCLVVVTWQVLGGDGDREGSRDKKQTSH